MQDKGLGIPLLFTTFWCTIYVVQENLMTEASAIAFLPGTTGKTFENLHVGATNSRRAHGIGVMASLDANESLEVWFPLPNTDPTGTLKLVIPSLADVAATQSAFLRVLWAAIAATENYDTISLNDEHGGGDLEIEHTTADDDEIIYTEVTLDADTITYGTDRYIYMNIDLKTASWDLAVVWTIMTPWVYWS